MAAKGLIRRASRGSLAAAFALAAALTAAPAAGLDIKRFKAADGLRILLLEGSFVHEDMRRVPIEVRRGGFDEVWLNSGGGHAQSGMVIGRVFREVGVVARVPKIGFCASACVTAFAGAPVRFVDAPYLIAVHPASISGSEVEQRRVASLVAEGGQGGARSVIMDYERKGGFNAAERVEYFLTMGVSPELVRHANTVNFNCGLFLSMNEMRYFNIVNTAGSPPKGYQPGDSRKRCN